MVKIILYSFVFLQAFSAFGQKASATFVTVPPTIDAVGSDAAWRQAAWQPLNQVWLGKKPTPVDFSGRFKMIASAEGIYVLAEITDDTLLDAIFDPAVRYWDDDCLELFVDPDGSGGDHQYNHQAFAYHLSTRGDAMDLGIEKQPIMMTDHVRFKLQTEGNVTTWEVFIKLYPSTYIHGHPGQEPMTLKPGATLGFGSAYCDNDYSAERETFVGSFPIPGPDTNRGWKDASLFTKVKLVAGGAAPKGK
jgi:hypothetical protein